jgi:hypothetical protein
MIQSGLKLLAYIATSPISDRVVDRITNYGLFLKALKAKGDAQPLFTTSDRVPLANADEKQEPAKKLMRFILRLEAARW